MKKFLDGVWEFCVKFSDQFFLGFIVPGIIAAVVWYLVEGEFKFFDKKNTKAPPNSSPVETQPSPRVKGVNLETWPLPEAPPAEAAPLTITGNTENPTNPQKQPQ